MSENIMGVEIEPETKKETLRDKAERLRKWIRSKVVKYDGYKSGGLLLPHQFWPDGRVKDVYYFLTLAVANKSKDQEARDERLRLAIEKAEALVRDTETEEQEAE